MHDMKPETGLRKSRDRRNVASKTPSATGRPRASSMIRCDCDNLCSIPVCVVCNRQIHLLQHWNRTRVEWFFLFFSKLGFFWVLLYDGEDEEANVCRVFMGEDGKRAGAACASSINGRTKPRSEGCSRVWIGNNGNQNGIHPIVTTPGESRPAGYSRSSTGFLIYNTVLEVKVDQEVVAKGTLRLQRHVVVAYFVGGDKRK